MPDAYILHRVLRGIAGWAVISFFTEIHVIDGENVPRDGPIIVRVGPLRRGGTCTFVRLTSSLGEPRRLGHWLACDPCLGYFMLNEDGAIKLSTPYPRDCKQALIHERVEACSKPIFTGIRTATHHNMMLDPAVLSCAFPYKRVLHYWAKASLFAGPMKQILTSAGNIPVDRKAADKRLLFRGTFRTLAAGEAVALFPEGTSYTEPHIMQVKDGAAWAALEYTKWARENPDKVAKGAENVLIIPAAIVYTNKSKYRSQVIMEFGQPISMDDYFEQFMSQEEGAPRAAVKRLTAAIERELTEATINAPDWDTLYAARMARDLLWPEERSINLDEFVTISQTLVDLFSTPDLVPNINAIKRHLLTYYSLLESTHLTNAVLSSLPLPATLDPRQPVPLPSRLFTLSSPHPGHARAAFGRVHAAARPAPPPAHPEHVEARPARAVALLPGLVRRALGRGLGVGEAVERAEAELRRNAFSARRRSRRRRAPA
ncbi:hypothetical protein NUW54_g9381 [Trametes sanguinea]|uniref:Uncharacterized protein n=1 Tax=Trametes sanguinea TaxID=158606 RepID=A0ACC1P9H0_9APHY|nr:hypothetical protein NUW54_g9381 [Trametes sanguinea]